MAITRMRKISICALKDNRKKILEELQRLGNVEVIPGNNAEGFAKMDVTGNRQLFERTADLIDQSLEILSAYAPGKKSLLESLSGKVQIERANYEKALGKRDENVNAARRIVSLEKKIAEYKASVLKQENVIESMLPWENLGVPLNDTGTKTTTLFIGTMPGELKLDELYAVLAEGAPDVDAVDAEVISTGRNVTYLTALCAKRDESVIENALRAHGFARPPQTLPGTPAELIRKAKETIADIGKSVEDTKREIAEFAPTRKNLELTADYYRIRAEKYEVLGELNQSERTFFLQGYIPERSADATAKLLSDRYDAFTEVSEVPEDEEAPVLLENSKFVRAGEGVLEAYGYPAKGMVDPSVIMMCCYVFLFGCMLSDAAYGAIVAIICGVLLKKCPNMERGLQNFIRLFFWCGISTVVWGVLFGGYFGDAVNVISRVFFGHEVKIPALWFEPLGNPIKLLVVCLLIGVIHLFLGLGIKGYMCLRDKDYAGFVFDVLCWYAMLTGLILMLIPSELFTSMINADIVFPAALNAAARYMAIAGAVGIVLFSARDKKNPGLRIALGLYDLYNVTGWLSDVLSYSRLLALGLATGVIAQVINQMGSMGGKSVIGVIMFILVFIIGHILNLLINLLGAYVHTSRLQYVEFFGKFYESGGRKFEPFSAETKYADIKED